MEAVIVILVILVFVFLNSLPFIAGVLATPAGSVFLGTIHWPGDYFYYLSQFAQGKENWFFSYDLYTNDFPQKTLVGWVNVFLGRVFSLVGVDHLAAYQVSVVIFTISFLALSYLLIKEIFPEEKWKRLIAFLLFTTANAFPGYDYWFNNGIPFNRLGGVPHHLIARTVVVLALFLAVRWWRVINIYYFQRTYVIIYIFSFLVLGFTLASVEPVHWILTVLVLFFSTIITPPNSPSDNSPSPPLTVRGGLGALGGVTAFFLGGLPMAIYLKRLFTNPPYSQLVTWEATQQVNISILNFILANGPVMVLVVVSLGVLVWKLVSYKGLGFGLALNRLTIPKLASIPKPIPKPSTILSVIFVFLTIGLFFSPIPRWVNIVNVRFLPAVTTLFLAILATEGITRVTRITYLFFLILIFLTMLPSYYVQIQNRIKTDPANSFYYIPQKAYEAYRQAEKISTPKDTFLVIWPFNWSFPGITGRRVYEGHNLLTINYNEKELMTRSFFFGEMSKNDMERMLVVNNIDYVVTYPWTRNINELTNIEKIYDNGTLGIYEVKR